MIAPWEVPNWAAHVTYMGVVALYIRKAWIRDLTVSYEGLSMMLIHTAAKLVTRTFEEPTVVGGAAATFSVGGSAWTNSVWTIGLGCYVRAERSARLEQRGYDQVASLAVHEACV